MRTLLLIATGALVASCNRSPFEVTHHVSVPSTNRFDLSAPTLLRVDIAGLDGRYRGLRLIDASLSYDGKTFDPIEYYDIRPSLDEDAQRHFETAVVGEKTIWVSVTTRRTNGTSGDAQITLTDMRR